MKSIILGVERQKFRADQSLQQLRQQGFTGIQQQSSWDGFVQGLPPLEKLGITISPDLRPGHQGCCQSHIKAWQDMVDEGAPARIFFEDDALAHAKIQELGPQQWAETPKDFDILQMGNMVNADHPQIADVNVKVAEVPSYCLHAQVLSLSGAKKLLELVRSERPLHMIDIVLFHQTLGEKIKSQVWNGTWVQKSQPTYDPGLPWQAFSNVIVPVKDTGIFYQNFRLGTTLNHETLQLTLPQQSR